jgi:hypothetical protein
MLVSLKLGADFSRGCALGRIGTYFSRHTPTAYQPRGRFGNCDTVAYILPIPRAALTTLTF